VTEKGQRPARAAKAVLGKYRLETAQEETVCRLETAQEVQAKKATGD